MAGLQRLVTLGLGLWHGPLGPLLRVYLAWAALLLSGLSPLLTGQLDWYGLFGERAVFAAALGAAGYLIWLLGERTRDERWAFVFTFVATLLALRLFPAADRLTFNLGGILPIHLGLCLQLLAWSQVARSARLGLWIMLVGMIAEVVTILLAQVPHQGVECATGTMVACLDGPYVAVALPSLITVLLSVCWLDPLTRRLRRGR